MTDISSEVYKQALRLMFSQTPVTGGMSKLDAICRERAPHSIWDKLRRLRYGSELPKLLTWTEAKLLAHPVNVAVLYFGLSDMGDNFGLSLLRERRSPKDEDDWDAFDFDSDGPWYQGTSRLLKRMYQIAETELSDGAGGYKDRDVRWIVETCYPLVYLGLALGTVLQLLPTNVLLGRDNKRRVAIVFGEGDQFFFGEVTSRGFRQYDVPDFAK